jgi:hypothetical protein
MTTNGTPFPTPPADAPQRTPTRHLVVDVRDGDLILETVEPTRDDLIAWLREHGDGDDMLTSDESARLAAYLAEPPRVIPKLAEILKREASMPAGDTMNGEPVRLSGAERGANAGAPCERHFPRINPDRVQCYEASGAHASPGWATRIERPLAAGEALPSDRLTQILHGVMSPRCDQEPVTGADVLRTVAAFLDEQWRERGGR